LFSSLFVFVLCLQIEKERNQKHGGRHRPTNKCAGVELLLYAFCAVLCSAARGLQCNNSRAVAVKTKKKKTTKKQSSVKCAKSLALSGAIDLCTSCGGEQEEAHPETHGQSQTHTDTLEAIVRMIYTPLCF
jgi:hypothetical protein